MICYLLARLAKVREKGRSRPVGTKRAYLSRRLSQVRYQCYNSNKVKCGSRKAQTKFIISFVNLEER